MKNDSIIIAAVAAAGLFFIWRVTRTGNVSSNGTVLNQSNKVNAVNNTALPGQSGWAWQYFTDGTAISPTGAYYYQGQEVYDPNGILKA